jgi:hypothetical protein
MALVDDAKSENDAALLAFLAQQDRTLEMRSRALLVKARPFQRCITAAPTPESGDCDLEHDELQRALEAFRDAYEGDPEADKVFWMSTFATDAETYGDLASDAVERLGRNKLKDTDSLRDAYADLARDNDTLNFDFP